MIVTKYTRRLRRQVMNSLNIRLNNVTFVYQSKAVQF